MDYLYRRLKEYSESDYYPFHMPGHKRNSGLTDAELPYMIDITEIEGFDDLHHAEGILKEAQERAAGLYGADETHYLINGSTAGILSAVMGCTCKGDKILMARNCHKSVYNAVYLNELRPVYIYPGLCRGQELNGPVSPEEIEKKLDMYNEISAVVITSPTYDGVVSDIKRIADIVHRKGIPLIVDEAHGAHFGFDPYFPDNANAMGADVVIHSLHKTLTALTQTALLHINGRIADRKRIRQYLQIFQSSSPSYVLMAGIDECIRMLQSRGKELFQNYVEQLKWARDRLSRLKHLSLFETEVYDRSKIVVSVKRAYLPEGEELFGEQRKIFTGRDLYEILLKKYHLQMEMAAGSYVVAMTSPGDTSEGMERLIDALEEIDNCLKVDEQDAARASLEDENFKDDLNLICGGGRTGESSLIHRENRIVYTVCEAEELERYGSGRKASLPFKEAGGKISLEYAYLYPPGVPLVVPGEEISSETAEVMEQYRQLGFEVRGTAEEGRIEVYIYG